MKIPQPYFRAFDRWWYVQVRVGGKRKQIRLCQGRENREQAIREYYGPFSALLAKWPAVVSRRPSR